MDKEFLMDYEAKEKEEIKKFAQKFREGKIGAKDVYPQKYRLKLNEPYTKSIAGDGIWAQVPLYGTTIVSLQPTQKSLFKKIHGFDIEDIDRLIDFVKDKRRIQFVLDDYPNQYIKMDYLEPIFKELMPPKLIHLPLQCIIDSEQIMSNRNEIGTLLDNPQSTNFIKQYTDKKYIKSTVTYDEVKKSIIDDLIRLKLLGCEDLVESFIGWLATVDISEYIILLQAIHDIFLFPYDPLKGIKSFSKKEIDKLHGEFPKLKNNTNIKIEMPYEIGQFLNNNLKLIIPKNLDGAIELSDGYDIYDLRKVMNTLNKFAEKETLHEIPGKSKEVARIFENVWEDAHKLKYKINLYRNGISFGFGVVCGAAGAFISLPVGGAGGFLSGLGFNVADKYLERKTYWSISEKFAKWRSQYHITHVYDFRKKYKLL
jgi:hypothetical protein